MIRMVNRLLIEIATPNTIYDEIINNLISPSIVVFCIEIIFIFSSFNICLFSQKACYTVI